MRHTLKMMLIVCGIMLAPPLLLICFKVASVVSATYPYWTTYTDSTQPIRLHFPATNVTYLIPANLLFGAARYRSGAAEVETALMFALLPDIEGRSEENRSRFKSPNTQDSIHILISSTGGMIVDVEPTVWAMEGNLPQYTIRNSEWDGLRMRRQIPPKTGNWGWKESYRLQEGGHTSLGIVCAGDGLYPTPGCTMIFSIDGNLVKATFRKPHLKDWRLIRDAITGKFAAWKVP